MTTIHPLILPPPPNSKKLTSFAISNQVHQIILFAYILLRLPIECLLFQRGMAAIRLVNRNQFVTLSNLILDRSVGLIQTKIKGAPKFYLFFTYKQIPSNLVVFPRNWEERRENLFRGSELVFDVRQVHLQSDEGRICIFWE